MPEKIAHSTLHRHLLYVRLIVAIFYVVGVSGLLMPSLRAFFTSLFPWFLLLNAFALAFFHRGTQSAKALAVMALVFVAGFAVEVAGVNTGLVFGQYRYGESLGFKMWNTPLIIGLNWLMLVYTTSGLVESPRVKPAVKILLASTVMLVYDLVLEQVAPMLDMWHWNNTQVPLLNYITWFTVAVIFHCLIKLFRVNTSNPVSAIIFVCQFLFFLALNLFMI